MNYRCVHDNYDLHSQNIDLEFKLIHVSQIVQIEVCMQHWQMWSNRPKTHKSMNF